MLVTIVDSGGVPVTETPLGSPHTVVESGGIAATLVAEGGLPIDLRETDGSDWTEGDEAPVNTSPPTITGTAQEGETLTGGTGTWENNPTFTRQWLADDVEIVGATGATLLLAAGQVGAEIVFRVTGTNVNGSAQAFSTATAPVAEAAATPPVNTSVPSISGDPTDGQTLTATTGTWSNTPESYTYRWYGDGVFLTGQTASTLVLDDAHIGMDITVGVIASNGDGAGTEAISVAVGPVLDLVIGDISDLDASIVGTVITLTYTAADNAPEHQYRFGTVNPPDGAWALLDPSGVVADVPGGQTVYFQVRGKNGSDFGDPSNVDSVATAWAPADEAAVVEWWDFSNNAKVFSDLAGTTQAVADSTSVLNIKGLKNNTVMSSSSNGPAYQTIGGRKMGKFTRATPSRLACSDATVLGSFDGDDDPYVLIGAFKRGAPDLSAAPVCFSKPDTTNNRVRHFFGGTDTVGVQRVVNNVATTAQTATEVVPADTNYVVAWHFTGTTVNIRVNGVLVGNALACNSAALDVNRLVLGTYFTGASTFDTTVAFDGAIGEVGIMDGGTDFSSAAYLSAEAYLTAKWL